MSLQVERQKLWKTTSHRQKGQNCHHCRPRVASVAGVRAGFEIPHLAHLGQTHPGGAQPAASFARSAHLRMAEVVLQPRWLTGHHSGEPEQWMGIVGEKQIRKHLHQVGSFWLL